MWDLQQNKSPKIMTGNRKHDLKPMYKPPNKTNDQKGTKSDKELCITNYTTNELIQLQLQSLPQKENIYPFTSKYAMCHQSLRY